MNLKDGAYVASMMESLPASKMPMARSYAQVGRTVLLSERRARFARPRVRQALLLRWHDFFRLHIPSFNAVSGSADGDVIMWDINGAMANFNSTSLEQTVTPSTRHAATT